MSHGATHDAAEHIAAPFVGGQYAIGDQERRRAQVIGDDAMGHAARAVGLHAREIRDMGDDRAEQVDLVVVVRALQHRGNALQAHAGVDRRARQVETLAARDLLVLHEDQIPDLDETIAVGIRRAGRAAGNVRPMIVEDFRARPARPQVAHLPEIVAAGDADDLALGQAGDLLPQVECLIVIDEDGDHQAIDRQLELLGNEIPGELDGTVLEIIAEGEVAEHLEEGMVTRGVTHIVEVVVLAARAHAFLRGGRARIGTLLQAGEDVLELHHAGIGEHEGRVVARHERRRRHDLMAIPGEIVEEARSDLVDAAHVLAIRRLTLLTLARYLLVLAAARAAASLDARRPLVCRAFSDAPTPCPGNPPRCRQHDSSRTTRPHPLPLRAP